MTRKLHNTLMATIASSSLLVVGLIASTPVEANLDAANASAVISTIDVQAGNAIGTIGQADAPAVQREHSMRPSRQPLAMPFFSFAPRS